MIQQRNIIVALLLLIGGGYLSADELNSSEAIESTSETTQDESNTTEASSAESSNAESSEKESASAGDIRDIDLGQSVVSASGYTQSIKAAPASISIVDEKEIMSRPIRDLGDAIQDVPGVTLEVQKTGQNLIYMRGLDSKYTLILIDGKRQNVNQSMGGNGFGFGSGFMPPASMIERIEVIRGPASVIYGSDAMGGVINIITKKNPSEVTGSFVVEGRFQQDQEHWGDTYGFNGYISAPLVQDVLSVNFRGRYNKSGANKFLISEIDGYTDRGLTSGNPYTSHSPTEYTLANVGGRVNWTIDSQNNIYLDSDLNYQKFGSLNTAQQNYTAVRDIYKWNSVLNHDGNYSWGNLSSYVQFDLTSQVPRYTTYDDGSYVQDGNTNRPYNKSSVQESKAIVLNSTWNDAYDYGDWGTLIGSAGIYYFYEQLEIKSSKFNDHQNQAAIYGEAEYLPFDLLSATFGLRLNYSDMYEFTPTPRFYININPTNWFTIKAGVSSGIMAPNMQYVYDGWTAGSRGSVDYVYGNKDLEPEKTWSYELGVIFDTPVANIIVTGFYTDYQNAINTITYEQDMTMSNGVICQGTCSLYENVDKALATGVEIGIKTRRFYGFGFDGSYAYTYTEQRNGTNKGLPVNTTPRHNLSAKILYNYEVFDVYLRWTGKIKTPTYTAHTANAGIGDFYKDIHILDLGASYRFRDAYTLSFDINNLLDTNFVRYVTYNDGANYTNLYQRMLPRRNFWVSIKADF